MNSAAGSIRFDFQDSDCLSNHGPAPFALYAALPVALSEQRILADFPAPNLRCSAFGGTLL